MTMGPDTQPGSFPKAIHGYNIGSVDEYFRKINSRLDSLVTQVQSERSRADQSKRLLEQMTAELELMRRRSLDSEARASAAIDERKRLEEENARLIHELKETRDRARAEVESAAKDARADAEKRSEVIKKQSEAAQRDVSERASAEIAELQNQAESLRSEVERLTARLTDMEQGGAGMASMTAREYDQKDLDSHRAEVAAQIEHIVAEARRRAEEAAERAAAVYREHEERVRALGDECESLVQRIREAVAAQLPQLPSVSSRPPLPPINRTPMRNESPDDRRRREGSDWRSRDWRSAS